MQININESIIPYDFGWRAGIGTEVEHPVYPTKGDEFFESLWYELIAEVEDQTTQFIYEMMTPILYWKINHAIKFTIDNMIARYPDILGHGFQQYLRSIKQKVWWQLHEHMLEDYNGSEYDGPEHPKDCEFILVDKTLSKIYLDSPYVINYLLNYKKGK